MPNITLQRRPFPSTSVHPLQGRFKHFRIACASALVTLTLAGSRGSHAGLVTADANHGCLSAGTHDKTAAVHRRPFPLIFLSASSSPFLPPHPARPSLPPHLHPNHPTLKAVCGMALLWLWLWLYSPRAGWLAGWAMAELEHMHFMGHPLVYY